ncbi:MAG: DAK2 domain-containing protein [Oscillospiraceae bacterium]
MNEQLSGVLFKQMVLSGSAAIALQKQAINDLNVFPVPDGDTGTNMCMTIQTAATELKKSEPKSLEQAVAITASALLRGARGNSGVILSLLFRGLSKSLKGAQTADSVAFANALQEGVASAYKAVMKPAEGTVLTVSRLAAKCACESAAKHKDIEIVLEDAIRAGYVTLAQTIEMNPVLKKAGVVDAGGKGYLIILEGMLAAMRGEPIPEAVEGDLPAAPVEASPFDKFDTADIQFAYCTEFIVNRENDNDPEALRDYLAGMGDSLVLVDDEEIIKVHVHTNHPGLVLERALTYGSFVTTKIENMKNQHTEILAEETAHVVAAPEKRYGFLSVCAGDGLAALFHDLGVDGVISGGQTMNPSTESILNAIDKTPAEIVFVLPNNGNIIMAAQQCVGLTEKQVVVVPTKTVPQGITAMMSVDFEAETPEAITEAMAAALETVTTAQITYAARNSDFDGFDISEGDYLALEEGKLFGTDRDIRVLLDKLAVDAATREAGFISLFFGEDVTEEAANDAAAVFRNACPDAEVSVLQGGQPVYYYIISME